MADSFRLIVRRGPQPNQTYDLSKDIMTLGRDITNDLVINDPEVSRHHLRFTRGADGFNIEDLGSTNGTFVNGQRLSGVRPLNSGDMIGLGETVTLGYERVRPDTPPPSPSAQPLQTQQSEYAPQPAQPAQQEQPQYGPQPQPQYGQQAYDQQYGQPQSQYGQQAYDQQYGSPQEYGGYAAPQAPPGYDYDPYAMREEPGSGAFRWFAIGCAILGVFCCCSSVVGMVIIDALSLWYDIPIIRDIAPLFERIASALGLI